MGAPFDSAQARLTQTALSRLPGASSAAVELELFNSIHEFCLQSTLWRETIRRDVHADKERYRLLPRTQGARVAYILSLQIDNQPLRVMAGDAATNRVWHGVYDVEEDHGTVVLSKTPTEDKPQGLVARVCLVPDETQRDELPEELTSQNFEPFLDGLMGRMLAHSNKPYTNMTMSGYHTQRFRAALTRARRIARGGEARGDVPWVYPQIAPGRRRKGGVW